jgi:hypothetical protein
MKAILRKRRQRERVAKKSKFRLRGMSVDEAKIHRYLKRNATSCIMADMLSSEPGKQSLL